MQNKLNILIVDDEIVNLMLLENILQNEGYKNVSSFSNSTQALEYLQKHPVDALITDFNMPDINGIKLLEEAKKEHPDLVSIMITANNDNEMMHKALQIGVTDFLVKPISPVVFKLRLHNILAIKTSLNLTKDFNKKLSIKVKEATAALQQSEYEALEVLSKAAEYKDPETASHISRVAHYSKLLAEAYGLSEKEQNIIFYAAPLHDIGKIGIDDAILLKAGKLTPDEFQKMQAHSLIGANILHGKKNEFLQAGEVIAASHHEKYNGKGYPKGLQGEEIPLYGRIVAVADVFDALTSKRPYKKAWSFEKALRLLQEEKEAHFDPKIVDLFLENIEKVKTIYEQFQED
ncbi:response regulator [Sulfurimonas sp. SWIR-19]|uniref:HD domain-containing phosphohydrolase n=1 Tax=Sulfurimonas sp. SWIR-19 TaxID=2878390 RepID=UPI001CF50C30|nr:HD domain-containing phosphohydrolase [Sulfurimonas sp. SWIR-19]UCN00374.1 response regulator [Sulfurimonas sp. SWIR-19]